MGLLWIACCLLVSVLTCAACAGTCSGSIRCPGQHPTISWSCGAHTVFVHWARGHRGTAHMCAHVYKQCRYVTVLSWSMDLVWIMCVRCMYHSMASPVKRLRSAEKETTRCLQATDLKTWSVLTGLPLLIACDNVFWFLCHPTVLRPHCQWKLLTVRSLNYTEQWANFKTLFTSNLRNHMSSSTGKIKMIFTVRVRDSWHRKQKLGMASHQQAYWFTCWFMPTLDFFSSSLKWTFVF